ncbi:MAG: hypothetical protein HYS21_00535 [Deltaproteobacteria bacterium]|nr:hypothetical protein [Deltaproteobacteria bacterium]
MSINWKSGITAGVLAGVIWGWLSMGLNSITGVVEFEGSFAHNFMSFTFGGAVFGILVGGLMAIGGSLIPFRNVLARAVFTSTLMWLVIRFGGTILSVMKPTRYNVLTPETMQGLFLAIVLGGVLAMLLKKNMKEAD